MTIDGPCLTHEPFLEDDARSTFVYDDIESPDSFSLAELYVVVNAHFRQECVVKKLGEGSYHKVNHHCHRITSN